MSTPIRVKLKQPGDAVVVHVDRVQLATTGKWPEVEIIGRDAKTHQTIVVAIPQKSVERQLERLGLTLTDVPGYTLGVSRSANVDIPEKPYWNLAVIGEPSVAAPAVPAAPPLPDRPVRGTAPLAEVPPPTDADAPPDALAAPTPNPQNNFPGDALYRAITEWVLADIAPLYAKFEVGPTPESVAAMVATLFIQHNRGR